MDYKNNIAVLNEIEFAKILCKDFDDVSFSCNAMGKDSKDRWLYGVVVVSFIAKGNYKLIKLLASNDYEIQRVKIADDNFEHSGYSMQVLARKNVKLNYD